MNKINIIGLNSVKTGLIKELMDLGVVEISSQDTKLTDPEWITYIEKDGNENEILNLDSKISKTDEVLNYLDKYDNRKKPMIASRRTVTVKEYENSLERLSEIEKNTDIILNLISEYNEYSSEQNKIEANIMSLKPWIGYSVPLEMNKTRNTHIFTGVVPIFADIEKLKSDIKENTDLCYLDMTNSDKDQHYISVICINEKMDDVYEILKQHGFNVVNFKDLTGTASENIKKYESDLKEISGKKKNVEIKITNLVKLKDDIQLMRDYLTIERDKARTLDNILKTDKTFYIEGWIPRKTEEKVVEVLKKYECWYEVNEPDKDEQTPVLLNNNSFTKPFEAITELYSLPSSANVDPTPTMAPFYCIFFGLMLADLGYGLFMAVACSLVLNKFKPEGTLKKMLKMFFYCGISTGFWGIMFGSFFGDAIPAAAKVFFNADVSISPVWINPMSQPMTLLIFSFILGVIHLFVGMGIKAYMLIRDGKPWDALFDIGFWYIFIVGLGLLLFGNSIAAGLGSVGKWLSLAGAVGLILTQGREKKNIIGKLIGGVMSLYNITSYLSDILSYSRLLALGLATSVVSSVVSILGSMGGSGFLGSILLIVVLLVGHSFNFAINALGAFVHAARLQYVEYFGKFYEGGGEAFDPLYKKTKYINIIKEEV